MGWISHTGTAATGVGDTRTKGKVGREDEGEALGGVSEHLECWGDTSGLMPATEMAQSSQPQSLTTMQKEKKSTNTKQHIR